MTVRHRSLRFGLLEALLVSSLAVGALVVWRSDTEARDVVAREERGLQFLRRVFAAESAYRAAGKRDVDGDGKPEYGTLDDLAAAGLVPGPVQHDDRGAFLATEGYRVEVLLPSGATPKGLKAWSPRASGHVDARLAATTCAVVARPTRDGARVLRGFYLDTAGYGYAVDGVYSPDRDPSVEPPLYELRGGDRGDNGGHDDGPGWRPFQTPPGVVLEKPTK